MASAGRGGRPAGPDPTLAVAEGLLAPLTLRTTGQRIAERFVTAIALGQFVPGQRLPTERDLAAMLGVSRATVREAIARLAESGYVTVRRGRSGGAFVEAGWGPESAEMIRRTISTQWQDLELLLDYRQLIEQQIARTAAQRRTDTDVKAIQAALADYERAARTGSRPGWPTSHCTAPSPVPPTTITCSTSPQDQARHQLRLRGRAVQPGGAPPGPAPAPGAGPGGHRRATRPAPPRWPPSTSRSPRPCCAS